MAYESPDVAGAGVQRVMMNVEDTFGGPLRVDRAIALQPHDIPATRVGPAPKVQYVIEIAGPRSLSAVAASGLLNPQWQAALGQPTGWVMAPMDQVWQPLTASQAGAYDSLALAWDMISPRGQLTGASAQNLLNIVEGYAAKQSRRAFPMPTPDQIDLLVKHWETVQTNLDIGFSMCFVNPAGPMFERDIWRLCTAMGLKFGPKGSFDWVATDGWEYPLLSVTPLEEAAFSLGAVQSGATHSGVTIGFNMPRCPIPKEALDACFAVGQQFALKLSCQTFDDEMNPFGQDKRKLLNNDLAAAMGLFQQAGIAPGSAEALKLFPPGA